MLNWPQIKFMKISLFLVVIHNKCIQPLYGASNAWPGISIQRLFILILRLKVLNSYFVY